MKPFRKNVAIAIDGGGIRGILVTRALSMLEDHLGKPLHEVVNLAAGTSTGSIISAGIAARLNALQMHELYLTLGETIFRKSCRSRLWPLTRYRYPLEPLASALRDQIGAGKVGDFWDREDPMDVVITAFDLIENRSRFIKPYKAEYRDWPIVTAVLASSSVPTFFPVVEGRYVDGGVGAYANPCYLAAYEILYCLKWNLDETTLISLGTGRDPQGILPGQPERFHAWDWIGPILDAFLHSADDQQVHLVETFFERLDFRRFQVNLRDSIGMDDTTQAAELVRYGEEMGDMILNDRYDRALRILPELPPRG